MKNKIGKRIKMKKEGQEKNKEEIKRKWEGRS